MEINVFLVVIAGLVALIAIISLYYFDKYRRKSKAEQEKRQQAEQSLEECKSELAEKSEQLRVEQEKRQQDRVSTLSKE